MPQLDVLERRAIVAHRDVILGGAVDELEDTSRQATLGGQAQILDIDRVAFGFIEQALEETYDWWPPLRRRHDCSGVGYKAVKRQPRRYLLGPANLSCRAGGGNLIGTR